MATQLRLMQLAAGHYATPDGRYKVEQPHAIDPTDPDRQWYVKVLIPEEDDHESYGPFATLREAKEWIPAKQNQFGTLTVFKPELDTILAALRLWQHKRNDALDQPDWRDIATEGDQHEPLNETDIDDLREKLNTTFSPAS